jgi:Mce-associated membrane protein
MTTRVIPLLPRHAAKDVDLQVETETTALQDPTGEPEPTEPCEDGAAARERGWSLIRWGRALAYGVLPGLALLAAMGAGYLKWQDISTREARLAGIESVRAATDSTVAMLSYRPDTAEKDLDAARDRLTGAMKDSYTSLTHDVVIPGAREKQISAMATVPAAAVVTASASHAVVLVFVNQRVTVGHDPSVDTASRVRVTLDKVGGRWLVAGFDPI